MKIIFSFLFNLFVIIDCKPQSVNIKRLISTYNNLKSIYWQSLSVESENYYLYIHLIMSPLMSSALNHLLFIGFKRVIVVYETLQKLILG